ncbi:MAG: hypothetical protein Q8936_00180 [Bacillota bacterium]|nr:hypothetical protein [Bacillota bacterium]
MHKFYRGDTFILKNKYGQIKFKRDEKNGLILYFNRSDIGISIEALYVDEELKKLLYGEKESKIDCRLKTYTKGSKKIYTTCFQYDEDVENENHSGALIFLAADSRYEYRLNEKDFKAMIFYIKIHLGSVVTYQEFEYYCGGIIQRMLSIMKSYLTKKVFKASSK